MCRAPFHFQSGQKGGVAATLKPGDVLITPKLDRMFRSALDALDLLAKLKARNVSLHMIDLGGDVTGNGIGKLVFTICPPWPRPSATASASGLARSSGTSASATSTSAASSRSASGLATTARLCLTLRNRR
jgi:hypothetical protein